MLKADGFDKAVLSTHNGSFAPSQVNHGKFVKRAGPQEKVGVQLGGLLPKGSLEHFIVQHP